VFPMLHVVSMGGGSMCLCYASLCEFSDDVMLVFLIRVHVPSPCD
jgi:hypothetical protein